MSRARVPTIFQSACVPCSWPRPATSASSHWSAPEMQALTRARLAWIQQSYIRADTITTANNRLVDVHARLPLTRAWGGGELASADGFASSFRSARYTRREPQILRPRQRRDVHQVHLGRQHRLLRVRGAGHFARLD